MNQTAQNALRFLTRFVFAAIILPIMVYPLAGCRQFHIDSADSIANKVISQRQREALGTSHDFDIGPESGELEMTSDRYAFVPHPIGPEVPESFRTPVTERVEDTADIDTNGRPFRLSEALSYAFRHARSFQNQKEDLYLAALSLMTERQLWTPQLLGEMQLIYENFGQENNFDQAMTAVAELSATQRLPYGGTIAARVISTMLKDLNSHITTGESGTMILEANIPLLRGAGRVAYESRYRAERELIYAVRDFEIARRDLVVDVAAEYFNLLSAKTAIESAQIALESAKSDLERSEALFTVGWVLQTEYDRSRVQVLDQTNELISTKAGYRSALDRFKIRIGMPTAEAIDAVEEELDLFQPAVDEAEATVTAMKHRLDLLTAFDLIDDARRDVEIANNNFLPQFDFNSAVTMNTDPEEKNSFSYRSERTQWRSSLNLELPLDRREERNVFRAALIRLRRTQRAYDLARDTVRLDVRDALRDIELAETSMEIQAENIIINEKREITARALLDTGRLSSNRDLIEAQQQLQASKNRFAAAQSTYRRAILIFLRDCGMLRVDDYGHWIR